jgi:tRNA pseudouridine55 synthase
MNDSTEIIDPEPIAIFKPKGLTPLAAVKLYARQAGVAHGSKLGYAGRLDPMADGVLLALIGPTNRAQRYLIGLDKRYRFSALLGVTTDTYDVLGLPQLGGDLESITEDDLTEASSRLLGRIEQPFPPYSAAQVKGHPLFWWARQGRLDEIAIPTMERFITSLDIKSIDRVSADSVSSKIHDDLTLITGDFRQVQIRDAWNALFRKSGMPYFLVVELEMSCSSGTYVRSIVHELGRRLGCGATTLSLTRTAVGPYTLADCVHVQEKAPGE